jgi:hypothetical protein
MFDVRATGDTAHIDKIVKFLPHTPTQQLGYHIDVCCRVTRGARIEHL